MAHLAAAGADAVGANCGRGPEEMEVIAAEMARARTGDLLLVAQSNAGLPQVVGDHFEYDATPGDLAAHAARLAELGVDLIGGCCGSTPAHSAAVGDQLEPRLRSVGSTRWLEVRGRSAPEPRSPAAKAPSPVEAPVCEGPLPDGSGAERARTLSTTRRGAGRPGGTSATVWPQNALAAAQPASDVTVESPGPSGRSGARSSWGE